MYTFFWHMWFKHMHIIHIHITDKRSCACTASIVNQFTCTCTYCTWSVISTALCDYVRKTHVAHHCVSTCMCVAAMRSSIAGVISCHPLGVTWTNVAVLKFAPLEINLSEIWIKMPIFPFKTMHLNLSSAKCRPFCPGNNVLGAISWHYSTAVFPMHCHISTRVLLRT